jgi:hypothetical protein
VTDAGGPSVETRRLPVARAFAAVLAHAYCFHLSEPERKRQMVRTYPALATRTLVVEVRFRPGLERIPDILDAFEAAVREAVAS